VLRRGVLAVVLVALVPGAPAHAGDASQTWKTIESEHFIVNYYEPNGDLARRVFETPWAVRVLDVRGAETCGAARIPGAATGRVEIRPILEMG